MGYFMYYFSANIIKNLERMKDYLKENFSKSHKLQVFDNKGLKK